MPDDLFSETKTETKTIETSPSSPINEMVGEGKKFKDLEALAHGKLQADAYIMQLEQQTADMREALAQQDKVDQLLAELQAKKTAETNSPLQPTQSHTETAQKEESSSAVSSSAPAPKSDQPKEAGDLETLVTSILENRSIESAKIANAEHVNNTLVKAFGDRSRAIVSAKAEELGLSLAELRQQSENHPRLVLELFGVLSKEEQTNRAPSTTALTNESSREKMVTTTSHDTNTVRDSRWYAEQRRTMPRSKFFSPKFQQQLFKDRENLGAAW